MAIDGLPLGAWSYVKRKSHDRHTPSVPNAHACRAKSCALKMRKPSALVMSAAAYVGSLDFKARKRSFENYILNESELLPDPYYLANEQWIDDVRRWPSVEFAILTLLNKECTFEGKGQPKPRVQLMHTYEAWTVVHRRQATVHVWLGE